MTNDYIYAVYELQSLFSRLLTNTMPASSNISKMFRAKETYYVRKIIEQLAHLKVVNYDSTLKHEIMQNCVNHAIELTAVYAQYLEVGERDDRNDRGILNDPEPIANQEPTIPYIQSIIDNIIETNEADDKGIGTFTPSDIRNIRTSEVSPASTKSIIEANDEEEEDYKRDSVQLNLPSAAIVDYNIDNVIFVRSVIHDDVIYILPRYALKVREFSDRPNGELYLTIGYADVCVFTESKLSVSEAKEYIVRLEKTIATNALDPRTVDLKSKGGIPVLTLQGYNWREYCEREECKISTPEKDRNVILRGGFKIARNTPDDLDHVELNWDNPYPFHAFKLPDSDYVLVPTCAPDDSDYKVSAYDIIRYLPKGLIDKEGIAVNNIWGLEETLNDCTMSFKISDALKIARISNPQSTPIEALMIRGVQKGCVLLTFDMSAIDDGPDSTFLEFRRLMKFPTFDQLDQKRDNYINMDIGHWGLTKYFFSCRNSIQSKMFEGCRLSATTFESLMLSIYNISPIGEFEDFIHDFINEGFPEDSDTISWVIREKEIEWEELQEYKDNCTPLYVACLLHTLGNFEFYYTEWGKVYLYELKSGVYPDIEAYPLTLKLIRRVDDE